MNKEQSIGTVKTQKKVDYSKYAYMFIAPFFLVFLVFQLYPIINTVLLSFTDAKTFQTEYSFIGFDNYLHLFKDVQGQTSFFLIAFKNTWIIWTISFIPQIFLALFLAAIFGDMRLKIKFQGFFKTFTYLPNIITVASIALLFRSLFDLHGPINQLLISMDLIEEPINYFISTSSTRGIVAFISFWMWYGYTFIILSAAIASINPALYEAAIIDGANSKQMFFRITLPLIKPILLFVLVTSFVGGMQTFDVPFMLTNSAGGPDNSILTVALYIYRQAFQGGYNVNIASAASIVMLVFIAFISGLMFKTFKIGEGK